MTETCSGYLREVIVRKTISWLLSDPSFIYCTARTARLLKGREESLL